MCENIAARKRTESPHGWRGWRHHRIGFVPSIAEESDHAIDQQSEEEERQHDDDEGEVDRVAVDGGVAASPNRAAEDDAASTDARFIAHGYFAQERDGVAVDLAVDVNGAEKCHSGAIHFAVDTNRAEEADGVASLFGIADVDVVHEGNAVRGMCARDKPYCQQ
jgi:hypothetical protein